MKKVQNKNATSKLYWLCALCFGAAYSLYCFVILPLYFSLDANVDFSRTVLPNLVGYVGTALEHIAVFVFYGVIIYGIYRFGYKPMRGMYAVFCASAVYKYLANMLMSWIRDGAVPTTWGWDLFNVVYYTAFELIMLWITVAIVKRKLLRAREQSIDPERLYDKSNCLMKSAFAAGAVTFGVKAFGNLVNDITCIIEYGFEKYFLIFLDVVLNYVSALVLGVLCYAISAFVSAQLYLKQLKTDEKTAD